MHTEWQRARYDEQRMRKTKKKPSPIAELGEWTRPKRGGERIHEKCAKERQGKEGKKN